jgi:histidinol-phosphatase
MRTKLPRLSTREFRSLVVSVRAMLRQSDAIVLRFLKASQSMRKSDGSEVTIADRRAERLLRRLLHSMWPHDAIFGEEYGGHIVREGRCWLVDPIDGTASYALGMPMFGSLLSLLIDGEPVFGCIHLSALHETTFAAIGHGCWHSHLEQRARRVHVAAPRPLSQAKVGMTSVKERRWFARPSATQITTLARTVGRLRLVGDCVQYALLCRGVLDAAVDPFMKPWDIGAVVPCVLEAGGSISDLHGEAMGLLERTSIVAASSSALRKAICSAAHREHKRGMRRAT